VVFGNPYSLKYFDGVNCVLAAYEEDEDVLDLAAQALFGAFPLQGTLPVSVSAKSPLGAGLTLSATQRLSYGLPEEVGMNAGKLSAIDDIAEEAILAGAMPGCVVLVAKDGKVVYHKAFGRHTYDPKSKATATDDIFDLASITKVAATTVSLMKLDEAGKFDPNDQLQKYLPELEGSNKGKLRLLDMLTHQARLTPWIKFYEKTISANAKPLPKYYDSKPSGRFPLPVAKDLWLRADYPDSIWQAIKDSPLEANKEYLYSDLGFYYAGEVVRRLTGTRVEDYAKEQFYTPLGLATMTYRPLDLFPLDRLPPTEEDDYFRARRIQGYVHDMGAAMLNQATGHAGLFSNANDLAVLMQMLLNKGYYGGRQYLKPETVYKYATRCGTCSRRGIGFDMRQSKKGAEPNLSTLAGDGTFGHLGFTGAAAWADPDHGIVFVFLSNRTYPTMRNNKFGKMNVRVRVQDAVYRAVE
jgi:CubicO group peptidase (beta-lactamase class C family)